MPTSNDDDNHRADDSDTDEEYARRAAEIDRRIGSAPPWSPLVHGSDGGGYRDFLDGRPVMHGALLELQAFDYVRDPADPAEERRRRLDRGILVSYETTWRGTGRQVVLYLRTGGHAFTADADESMRFRWPAAKD
jgi:hypothetical protein